MAATLHGSKRAMSTAAAAAAASDPLALALVNCRVATMSETR